MKIFRTNQNALTREALSPAPRRIGLVAIGALLGALVTGGGTMLVQVIGHQLAYEHRLLEQHSRDVTRIRQLEASNRLRGLHLAAMRPK